MKPLRNAAFLAALIAVFSFSTFAQNSPPAQQCVAGSPGRPMFVHPGAPYSATQVLTIDQTLADGTRIHRELKMNLFRDSQGRTRTEMFSTRLGEPGEMNRIEIQDPVACTDYVLSPRDHTARRTDTHFQQKPDPQALAKKAQASANSVPPVPEYARPQFSHESLGQQMILGVSAGGMRTTSTLPAGADGNDHPLISVQERWVSPELGLELMRKVSDPRAGNQEMHVTSLDRSEPDPSLFQLPADYTLLNPGSH